MEADLAALEAAAAVVRTVVPPTPQYCWPLLSGRVGAEVWVKHENHTPIGAFKLSGGLVYLRKSEEIAAGDPRGRHRNPWQSWAKHRLCGVAAWPCFDDRSAAWQQR